MENFIGDLSLVLVTAAILGIASVIFKQPIIIAYIMSGIIIGPWGLALVRDADFIQTVSHLGITLLLFLAGLTLHPQKLIQLFKETSLITITSCISSFILSFSISKIFGFSQADALIISLALMFSSTILVVKLLPTTALHQQRMGAICIGILIFQDLLAVGVLAFIRSLDNHTGFISGFGLLFVKLLLLILVLFVVERYILRYLIEKVSKVQESLFILGLAWCFGIATISENMGLFYETGAFFAGVALADHKISLFISEKLKPLRDFFLVLFFFTLGAKLDLLVMKDILIPAVVTMVVFIVVKPLIFTAAFNISGEENKFAKETGLRLGQLSEFSLLIALMAVEMGQITVRASQFIQLSTILTFIVSSYLVVFTCPTPIGTRRNLFRD